MAVTRGILAAAAAALLAAGCGRRRSLIEDAAEREFGSGAYGCADTIAVARKAGVDYVKTVDAARRGDRQALGVLFRLTVGAGLDAASSQGHAAVLGGLLRELGDRFYAECLAGEREEIRRAVAADLSYDMDEVDVPEDQLEWRRKHPRTSSVCPVLPE